MATSARLDELKKKFDENPRRYFAPLANEYRKLGDLTQAIALCRAHLPNQPGHISGHIVLAQALYEARELGESRQIFEASLDLDPENLIALRYLGDIAREQGEPMQARAWYERVLDADPRNDDIATLLRELNTAATATDEGDESRVPALEDLSQHENVALASPTFSPAIHGDESAESAPLIDPLVSDSASDTPAWGTSASLSEPVESSASDELLHDLPEAGEPLSFFEESTTQDTFASSVASSEDDPFFGAGDAAGSLVEDELPSSANAAEDDWFASASASPEHEGIEALATSEAARFEDSFLPDLAQVTPIDSLAVSEVSDPEAAPTFVDGDDSAYSNDAQLSYEDALATPTPAATQSSIPTPPFLSAVDEFAAVDDSSAEAPTVAGADSLDLSLAASAPTPADSLALAFEETPLAAAYDAEEQTIESEFDATAGGESMSVESVERDEPTLEVDVIVPDDGDDAVQSPETPAFVGSWSNESEQAPIDATPSAFDGDFVVEYGEFVAPANDETPFIAESISVPLDDERALYEAPEIEELEPSTVLELSPAFEEEVVALSPVFEEPAVEASSADESLDVTARAIEASFDVVASAPEAEFDAVVMESEDEAPVVADTSFDLEAVDETTTPELEPVALELEPQQEDEPAEAITVEASDAPLVGETRESWRDADAVAPIEGLISREVDAVSEPAVAAEVEELESEAAPAPAFVTETMAELYLQQGFTEEALAIYRQLLVQQPGDATLEDRIAAIERGASSTVVDGVAPRDSIDRAGQSVRSFFGHFARRTPRARSGASDGGDREQDVTVAPSAESDGRTAGAATRDEALTVPDDGAPPATLSQLFASGVVSGADESAASSLASAFGGDDSAPASRIAERELSLEHLFRDVPARSSGAVTLDEFYQSSSPEDSDPSARDAADGEERGADIEQFTAWLEGLKKK